MQHNIFFTLVLVSLSILVFAGCNNPDARFAKVEGTITYNGVAVEGASVTFAPASGSGDPATGLTKADGKFTLTTPGAANAGSGAVPADYIVLVSKVETTQTTDPDELLEQKKEITYEELQRRLMAKGGSRTTYSHKELLPARYGQGATPLKATVNKGKNQPFVFELTD